MEDGGGWWWVVRIDLRLAKERKTPTPTVDSKRENKALAISWRKLVGQQLAITSSCTLYANTPLAKRACSSTSTIASNWKEKENIINHLKEEVVQQ